MGNDKNTLGHYLRVGITTIALVLVSSGDQPSNNPGNSKVTLQQQRAEKSSPTKSLDEIIQEHAIIEKIINPEGQGRFYLIGQEHYYAGTDATGKIPNAVQEASLAPIQSEIYHLLLGLARNGKNNLVIGEGLGPKQLISPHTSRGFNREDWALYGERMNESSFSVHLFKKNPEDTGYTFLELFHPDLVYTQGVDDVKLSEELKQMERQAFKNALRFVPTKMDYHNPVKRAQLIKANKPLEKRKREIHDERSRIYLVESQSIADQLGHQDVAVVIGRYHIPLMVSEYTGKRALYILRPKSITTPLLK